MNCSIIVDLIVDGIVNGESFSGRGNSFGQNGGGLIEANFKSNATVPSGFDLGILPYVLVTGQPSLSRNKASFENPFIKSVGAYNAVRSLDLGRYGKVRTEYEVLNSGEGRLRANFRIDAKTDLPVLKNIKPTIETWTPVSKGRMLGHFTMVWETADGNFIKGEADSDYYLPLDATIPRDAYRLIKIDMTCTGEKLIQTEIITILPDDFLSEAQS